MAKGKKREKRANYVGSKSDLAAQEEARLRAGGKKKDVTVNLINGELYALIPPFIWLFFLALNMQAFLASVYWLPTLIMAVSLSGLFHESSKKRFVKNPRIRRFTNSLLTLVLVFSVILLVMAIMGKFN